MVLFAGETTALASEPSCGGKFQAAEQMVDAAIGKYGTLYSGGSHFSSLDDVGATIDLYRLWRRLPDIKLRANRVYVELPYPARLDAATAAEVIDTSLSVMEMVDPPQKDPVESRTAAVYLDLATAPHRPAYFVTERPALAWLQAVVTASDAPWAFSWHLDTGRQDPEYDAHAESALAEFRAGRGIEWAVAALLLLPRESERQAELIAIEREWEAKVLDCRASAQEYAAWAVSVTVTSRLSDRSRPSAPLPPSVRALVARNTAMQLAFEAKEPDLYARLADDIPLTPNAHFERPGPGKAYVASSLDQLASLHPLPYRIINLLPATSIEQIARAQRQADRLELLRTAFARHVALGRWNEAAKLVEELRAASAPDVSGIIETIWAADAPVDVKLALIALKVGASTWIVGRNGDYGLYLFDRWQTKARSHFVRDLPDAFKDGAAVQGDFETWLMLPQKRYRYRTMRGFLVDAMEREYTRHYDDRPEPITAPTLFGAGSPFGLNMLVDLNEVDQLTGEKRFSRQVSLTLLRWADERSDSWWERRFGNHEMVAETLHRVVVMARYEDAGDINGVPIGKRAFKLLHKRFPRSEWARKTPYWHLRE